MRQSVWLPVRFDEKMTNSPSGVQVGVPPSVSSKVRRRGVPPDDTGVDGSTSSVRIRRRSGQGLLLDQGEPFHDALVRPALPDEVSAWLDGTNVATGPASSSGSCCWHQVSPPRSTAVGSTGTRSCAASRARARPTRSGLLLERVLADTTLRVVILDPNSDYVGLGGSATEPTRRGPAPSPSPTTSRCGATSPAPSGC